MSDAGKGAQGPGPRDVMPTVAKLVDAKRVEYGAAHVRECITRGMRGEPGWFYAFEGGMVQGTPFDADQVVMDALRMSVVMGSRYAFVMRPPVKDAAATGGASCS
jgi:hypothetical protein